MAAPPFDTLEEAFAEIARRGMMVNNLMQIEPRLFRASLRMPLQPGMYSGFSEGRSPLRALNRVLIEHGIFSNWESYQKPKETRADRIRKLLG